MVSDVEQAFRNNELVTLIDGFRLYQIVELNKLNKTVLLDEMYNDEGHYYSKHFPKVLTGWESVYMTGKHVIESEERHEGNGDL
ncbi:hypothetical protein [Limosilactobacillus mucosae]|uniref:hypothetical protein n=1 Tax=Limosilactobacillus mucosae TaxID=97478 RepID=UPI0008912F27|nr:hypothetical protein [Limosilactobacillus mucosae]SDN53786.1 hypothetical protein SAMN05216430_10839 [Limosilactobacillus mucosae]SEL11271.1 hypothetical protein SAMN05216545_10962 [Limosilactobacillus mucosae]SFK24157.1 hypothetical protein SAMN05216461_10862 [Limosilactobacillus mucosae]